MEIFHEGNTIVLWRRKRQIYTNILLYGTIRRKILNIFKPSKKKKKETSKDAALRYSQDYDIQRRSNLIRRWEIIGRSREILLAGKRKTLIFPTFHRSISHSVLADGEQYTGWREGIFFSRRSSALRGGRWGAAWGPPTAYAYFNWNSRTPTSLFWPTCRRDDPARGYCFKRICKSWERAGVRGPL